MAAWTTGDCDWIGVVIEPTSGVPVRRAAWADRKRVSKLWLIWWMTSGRNSATISSILRRLALPLAIGTIDRPSRKRLRGTSGAGGRGGIAGGRGRGPPGVARTDVGPAAMRFPRRRRAVRKGSAQKRGR